jgi:hypothetical protein
MNLQERVQRILVQPKTEWPVIEAEQTDVPTLYKSYIAPLAAIGPICTLLGMMMIGMSVPLAGQIRWGLGYGLRVVIVQYIGMLIACFVAAVVFSELAPTFASRKDRVQALKLVAYAMTASWLAGVLNLIPFLAFLGIIAALYSLYTLYVGLPVMMKTPPDRVIPYFAVGFVVTLVANIVLFFILGALSGGASMFGAY